MIHVHVDLDNLWVYEKEFGVKIQKNSDFIYSQALPQFLNLLKKTDSRATFMVVGKDLSLSACRVFCQKAISEGHEIANHTWSHHIFFNTLSYEQKKQEILKAHLKIAEICGKEPVGFRGPGYYQDKKIVTFLKKLNYKYDSSILPGLAPFLMHAYANMKGGENRNKTFGQKRNIPSKNQPYFIYGINSNQRLVELPISILPFIRLPIHTTFAYFFGHWYRQLILNYLKSKPSYVLYLFHAIDFVDFKKKYPNHPVIPLRYSFKERMSFAKNILETLVSVNGGGLRTSGEYYSKAIRH